MHLRSFALSIFCATFAFSQEDSGPRLTAREIFYGAKPAAPAAPAKAPSAPKAPAIKKPTESMSRPQQQSPELPIQVAAQTTTQSGGLAMRWTITQLMPDGDKKEVPTTKAFKSGDRINVRVEVNEFGYLYILARGSSGKWSPLFPSPAISGGDNRVGPNQPYTIPHNYVFKFDDQPGEERIFIVFSRKPEPDFDSLIYKVAPDRTQKPESPAARPSNPNIMLAQATMIGDPFVDKVRTMYARDLIVEKVEGEVKTSSIGPRFEHAAYVASKRSDDPRVTAEVTLIHK
ncbi:MAG: DUF4384 domain-containing protein [Acidobacteria bacterium]|nr:DUF4384 domain-containing protein [Acidobacteriota bacterium]